MANLESHTEFFVASEESGAEDSDEDLVTDYLDSVDNNGNVEDVKETLNAADEIETMAANSAPDSTVIPTISVTQHSPSASKAFCILEDNLRQLRGIQESIQRMRQVSVHTLRLQLGGKGQRGLGNLSASCPSLNSIAANNNELDWLNYSLVSEWDSPSPPNVAHYWGGSDTPGKDELGGSKRRRSWTSATEAELEPERIGIVYEPAASRRRRSISLSSGDTDNETESTNANKVPGTAAEMVDGLLSKHLLKSEGSAGNSSHSLNDIGVPLVLRSSTKAKTLTKEGGGREKWLSPRILTLQKSISTPSILAVKDGSTVAIAQLAGTNKDVSAGPISSFARLNQYTGLESETEDELPIPDHASRFSLAEFPDPGYENDEDSVSSKRRKRGSLFFRKRKDKEKEKSKSKSPHNFVSVCHSNSHLCDVCSKSMTNKAALRCESCAITVHEHSCKDQLGECTKFKVPKSIPSGSKLSSTAKQTSSTSNLSSSGTAVAPQGSAASVPHAPALGGSATSPTVAVFSSSANPLLASKPGGQEGSIDSTQAEDTVIVNTVLEIETVIVTDEVVSVADIKDLDLDPDLGVLDEEPESWIGTVDKKIAKKLKEKEIKRQEHIYEFIITEKHHCLTLKVMQKIFAEGMRRELNCPKELLERIFPCLDELIEYHLQFLRRLRQRQRQDPVVSTIEDILRFQFSGHLGDQLRSLYGEFCSRHQEAVSLYKDYVKEDRKLAAFVRQCTMNPLCKKKGIPECILFVTQRITKYPLLIDPLIKTSREDPEECQKLQEVLAFVKDILIGVNSQVAEKERKQRLIEIYNKIDAKSATVYRNKKFKKSDLLSGNRRLMFEGVAYLTPARGKAQLVTVVVLSDVVFFLQETNQKFYFFSQDNKAGVISLQKLLIREKAGGQDTRAIYLISSNPAEPEMYELQCHNPKEKKQWIDAIRLAVEQCPEDDEEDAFSDSEEQRKIQEARTVKIRQLISNMKDKDREVANLLEEKMRVFSELIELLGNNEDGVPASAPWSVTGTENGPKYSHLVNENLNSPAARETLQQALGELNRLLGYFYSGSAGGALSLGLSRSVSSAGERHSDTYNLPPLPKRAETFGGFDHSLAVQNGKEREKGVKKKASPDSLESSSQSTVSTNEYLAIPSGVPLLGLGRDQQVAGLHVAHHVSSLMTLLSSQASALESAKVELMNDVRLSHSGPSSLSLSKTQHKLNHNQRLEELRNLQDRLSKEKSDWLREKTQQEEQIAEHKKQLAKLQEQLRAEKTDVQQQRENLYQKLEALRSQGILLSPANMAIVTTANVPPAPVNAEETVDCQQSSSSGAVSPGAAPSPPNHNESRRRTIPGSGTSAIPSGSTTAALLTKRDSSSSLPLPINLLSAKNEQKAAAVLANNPPIKQQLPMKLAKLASSSGGSNATSPVSSNSLGSSSSASSSSSSSIVQQLLPLRLSENLESKRRANQPTSMDFATATKTKLSSSSFSPPASKTEDFVVGHARTGSGPASLPQVLTRAPTYPRVPDKPAGLVKTSPLPHKQQQQQQKVHDPETNQEIVFL